MKLPSMKLRHHAPVRTRRFCTGGFALALIALSCCSSLAWAGGPTPPVIDGKGQDLIDFGNAIDPGHPSGSRQGNCVVNTADPTRDILTADPKANPCDPAYSGGYFVNGKDLNQFVLVYDRVNNDIYVLWRTEGAIGDLDGNGNPDNNLCASDPDGTNIPDQAGISGSDKYRADFDLNCNNTWDPGEPSIRIQGSTDPNSPTSMGLTMLFGPEGPGEVAIPILASSQLAYRAVNGATGRELEAVVHLGTGPGAFRLPALYRVRGFSGSEDDYLGEDATTFEGCTAALDIALNKTATPTLLCPNGTTTVTLTVHNTSNVPLTDVSMVDDLPAGLSYVANTTGGTCGVGEPTVTAQHVEWPHFNLDFDQTCTITFQVRKEGPACLGTVTNHSEVTAIFQSPCFSGGSPVLVGPAISEFPLVCVDAPKVALTLGCSPARQCEGGAVTVIGTATNQSGSDEDITITVAGTTQTFPAVAPGDTRTLTVHTTLTQCPDQTFSGSAFGHNPCGDSGPPATDQCSVHCIPPPAVTLTLVCSPDRQCEGGPVTVTGTATNTSTEAEDITITVAGTTQTFPHIDPNATATLTVHTTLTQCPSQTFKGSAFGHNDCGDSNPAATAECRVQCIPPPGVTLTLACSPERQCEGGAVTVTGTVTNTSDEAEDITVTVAGTTQVFPNVASHDTRTLAVNTTLTQCPTQTFSGSAFGNNDCGNSNPPATASCAVTCLTPEIQVVKTASTPVDAGGTIHYTLTVRNPSSEVDLEHVRLTDDLCTNSSNPVNFTSSGGCVGTPTVSGIHIVWPEFSLVHGATCVVEFDATLVECADCVNHTSVSGLCAGARAEDTDEATTVCVPHGICRLTGGGCLNENGGNKSHKQNTFGGNVSPLHTGGGPTGNEWEHVLRDGNDILFNFHSHDAHITACTVVPPGPCSPPAENTRADFEGTGQYSFGPGGRSGDGNMVAYIIDHGEGKCGGPDYYTITVREGLTIGSGAVVFSIKGESDCGNLQIHETPTSIFKPLPGTPTPDAGSADGSGVVEGNLYRAIPNPFSTAMSYSYRVPAGAEQSVEIGAYDMAGRLVRKLASGAQGAGMYTVRWDGRSDAGEAIAPGVYFVRAQVAGARQVTRVVFLKP